jgi:dGTP triphosphohydrolase
MFERVYLGPETRPEHERAHEAIRRIFASGAPVEFIAGMTDRFALSYAERC